MVTWIRECKHSTQSISYTNGHSGHLQFPVVVTSLEMCVSKISMTLKKQQVLGFHWHYEERKENCHIN